MVKNKKTIFFIIIAVLILILVGAFIIIKQNKNKAISTCIVQFESSGGTKIKLQEIEQGLKVIRPEDPIKEGFTFIEWQLNGEAYNFDSLVTGNIILNAKWEVNEDTIICTVTFDSCGGSKIENIEVAKGNAIEPPIMPKREGYIFKGWFLQEEKFNFANPINEDIKLEAKWIEDTNKSEDKKNEHIDSSNGVITTESDEIDENSDYNEIDNLVYDYLGTWYLEGYSDVYIEVTRYEYWEGPAMLIHTTNFSADTYMIYPTFRGAAGYEAGFSILYRDFSEDLKNTGIKLTPGGIEIEKNGERFVFVKSKGSKDKYSYFNTMYKKSIGTWYLYNNPESKIIITATIAQGVLDSDYYTIETTNFSITTFETNISGGFGGDDGVSDALFNKYGITIDNDTLTIKNSYGTRVFYKTPITVAVDGVTLNTNNLAMYLGDMQKLSATVSPTDAYNSNIIWSSSNTGVVTVDSSGNIKAISPGTAIITVKTEDGNYTASCNVTVSAIATTGISIDKTNINMILNESQTINATIYPANSTNKNIIWSSSNTGVATVDSTGKVIAQGIGTATITAKTEDGGYTASCNVTVSYPQLTVNGSIGFSIKVSDQEMVSGIEVTANPSGGTGIYNSYNIKLYYNGSLIGESSSNTLFVNQTSNGTYSATITVVDSNGTSATVTKMVTKS